MGLFASLLASVAFAAHATCKIKGQIMNVILLICAACWIHANVLTCGDKGQSNYGTGDKDLELQFLTPGSRGHQCSQQPNPGCQNYFGNHFVPSLAQNLGNHTRSQPPCGSPIHRWTHSVNTKQHCHILPHVLFCTRFQPVRTREKYTVNIVTSES